MTTSKERKAQIVDPLDAEAALSEMQSILRHRGMSTTDLAVELGWTRNMTEDFFFGVDFPSLKQFQAVASVLQYRLEF